MRSPRPARRIAALALLLATRVAGVDAQSRPAADDPRPATTSARRPTAASPRAARPPLDLTPPVIRSAVSAADTDYVPAIRGGGFGAAPSNARARIDRAFDAAAIEHCAGPGAFRFEPVPVSGLLAAPFLVRAMLSGRCAL